MKYGRIRKYRVEMLIRGTLAAPAFRGFLDVFAESDTDAGERAKWKLLGDAFRDRSPADFRVERVDLVPRGRIAREAGLDEQCTHGGKHECQNTRAALPKMI